jgi:hypothetical protein
MRLEHFISGSSRIGEGRVRFETPVADITGSEDYRLVIDGPEDIVREIFAEGNLEFHIDPRGTRRDWYERYEPVREQELDQLAESVTLDTLPEFFSPRPKRDLSTSVLVSLHRIRGKGSIYVHPFRLSLYAGWQILMFLPPVCTSMAVATCPPSLPDLGGATGGRVRLDLMTAINSALVATSTNPLAGVARVTFSSACWPWTLFLPILFVTELGGSGAYVNGEFAGATFFP